MLVSQKDGNVEFDDENQLETVTSTRSGISNKKENNSSISAVRLQISINEIKCCRKVTLKGVYGDPNVLRKFINMFKKKIFEHVSQLPGGNVDLLSQTDISHDTEMTTFRGFNN